MGGGQGNRVCMCVSVWERMLDQQRQAHTIEGTEQVRWQGGRFKASAVHSIRGAQVDVL